MRSAVLPMERRWRGWMGCGATKWTATVASIWIQCTSGSSYCFGIYSPILKSSQGYDQSTLDYVAFFKDFGANAGILSGLLYSAAPSAPWIVLTVGAVQGFVGYFFMWLSVTGAVPRPPVPLVCLYMLLAAHAQTFFNTADVVTAVQNFPSHRGTAVGIMKGFLGLSGAILIQIYRAMYKGSPSSFLLMLALLPTLTSLLLMCFVKVYPSSEYHGKRHLNGFSIIALGIAFYLMSIIILENVMAVGFSIQIILFAMLIFLLISPLSIAIRAQMIDTQMRPQSENMEAYHPPQEIATKKNFLLHDEIAYHKISDEMGQESCSGNKMHGDESLNVLEALCTIDFWLLFISMACGMGSGLATVNNISQIGASLSYTSTETSTLVSLWSIWNFLGRFGAGYVSDYFLYQQSYPRPLFIAITLALMSVGHGLIASGLPGTLYAGSVLVGICYGSQWSLMPTITSEIFGLRHMGTIFNTVAFASPFGSYILSVRIVGYIYDIEASRADEKVCTGTHCFMLSFLIMSCATLSGCLVAMVLFFRTRVFYKQVIFPRSQHSVIS